MRVYIATPINAREGGSMEQKLAAAQERIRHLKQVLKGMNMFSGCEFFSTFDIPRDPNADNTEARAMGDCITAVLNCDAIYLDKGWLQSKGCNLEYRAAKIYGKFIYYYNKL